MLARKYNARRGVGRDSQNPVSVAASTSTRLNHIKRRVDVTNFKRLPETHKSEYLKEKKTELLKCQGVVRSEEYFYSVDGIDPENRLGKTNISCEHIQNLKTKTRGEHIEENLYCSLPKHLQKPMIENIACGAK